MPVSLDTFANLANRVDESRSIYLNKSGLHDTGKLGSLFTRAETFRNTTRDFLKALRTSYGDHVGNMATKMLQADIDAGKPLTGAVIKQFISYGEAEKDLHMNNAQMMKTRTLQAESSLQTVMRTTPAAQNFMRHILKDPQRIFSFEETTLFQEAVRHCAQHLTQDAPSIKGDILEAMGKAIHDGTKCPFLKTALDIIMSSEDGVATHPEQAQEALAIARDQLHAFFLIASPEDNNLDQDLIETVFAALPTLRSVHPHDPSCDIVGFGPFGPMTAGESNNVAGTDLTCEQIFNATFPPATTPTMERPSDEELEDFTSEDMKTCLQQARKDFQDNYLPGGLPQDLAELHSTKGSQAALERARQLNVPLQTFLGTKDSELCLDNLHDYFTVAVDGQGRQPLSPELAAICDRLAKPIVANKLNRLAARDRLPNAGGFLELLPPHNNALPELKVLQQLLQQPNVSTLSEQEQDEMFKTMLRGLKLGETLRSSLIDTSEAAKAIFQDCLLALMNLPMERCMASGNIPQDKNFQFIFSQSGGYQETLQAICYSLTSAECCNRALTLPPENRLSFLQATALFTAHTNPTLMDQLMEHQDGLQELHKTQRMNREQIWELLYNSPLPDSIPSGHNIIGVPEEALIQKTQRIVRPQEPERRKNVITIS